MVSIKVDELVEEALEAHKNKETVVEEEDPKVC